MWLVVGETEDCVVEAVCKGARMWLEVGEIEDCMAGAKYQEA